jgi:Tfp pilus assembly PilM family ATPase
MKSKVPSRSETKLFPVPKYLKMESFGLDISNSKIRLIKLVDSDKGLIPEKFEVVNLEKVCDIASYRKSPDSCNELKKELSNLKNKHNINFVKTSIPESESYIFKTTVSKESSNLEEAVSFKIEENVPLNPQDVVFDFKKIGVDKKTGDTEVIVTAASTETISIYSDLIKSAGMTPTGFMTETQAISNAAIPKGDDSPYLLVHMDDWGIVLSIIDDGFVQYVSSVSADPSHVVKDFESLDAKTLKDQINKVIVYWFTNKHDPDQEDKIQVAILSGHYADKKGLVEFLNKNSQISVSRANVWQNCFDVNEYVPPIKYENSLKYAAAVGLALGK